MVVALIGLATSVIAIYNFSVVNRVVGLVLEENYQTIVSAQNMVRTLERQENAQLAMILDDIDDGYISFSNNRDVFLGYHERARVLAHSAEDRELLDRIAERFSIYDASVDTLYRIVQTEGQTALATDYKFKLLSPLADTLKDDCFTLLDRGRSDIEEGKEQIRSSTYGAMLTVIIASIVSIILTFVATIQFTRAIRPLEKLTGTVRKIGSGSLAQKIDVVTDDEIGELSVEFNKMTERLQQYEEMNIHQLIAEKKKSETIVANIADPVILTDTEGSVILMNREAERVFRVRHGHWQGRKIREVIQNKEWLEQLYPAGSEPDEKLLQLEQDGRTFFYRPQHAEIMDERKIFQGRLWLLQDVTRFKNLERMKSEFVATVSHELRTPLTSLNMSVDILAKNVIGEMNERQRELVAAAKDDVERLRKLVHDLLNLSRIEASEKEIEKERLYIRELIDDALKPLRLPFKEKEIDLVIDVDDALPMVSVNRRQYSWVISNLANNGLRFTEPGGSVTFTAAMTGDEICMSVRDTGCGIPSDEQETIFDKFVQVESTDTGNPGSVGLGLAIARGVVEAHGGKIWVESTVDAGSTFSLTIPAS
jgi:PAS domain S-box-containing protein